ncbi:protein MpCupin16 [Marchantia polymorpha subsp. ruderalis]|uniref:Germin-like protein n=1 Tax=Marchantia polymorpha TaxID=3197 RepID=A0A2R6W863_MARPO|nr:hypothetical protein MARPO_0130s0001 [Marchantia polymorpha]BBN00766.1 hypothetical protein Mp_2g01930 [Marchantia polymorpha subsp. ruderalis]|eukprot:PTQ30043.1 hypothetical protein MARPO_0130s0001 [Marchantia polymorpha]
MEKVRHTLFFLLMVTMMVGRPVAAADPDITTDFGINVTSGAQLQFTGFRNLPESGVKQIVINFAFDTQFPGVIGLGIAPALLKFGPLALNSVHHHPRASEVFYIIDGELDAGVVDTKNNLFTATLKKGDVFVFPKGLMHFQINRSKTKTATVIAVFNSENAGRVSWPPTLFNSNPRIPTDILMEAFNLDKMTVDRLKLINFPSA